MLSVETSRATLGLRRPLKVKIPALACALLCRFAAPELTKAQAEAGAGWSVPFKGLHRIRIEIEDLNKADEDMGPSRDSLKDQILVALKRDVSQLKIDFSPGVSYVYLQIASIPIQASHNVVSFVHMALVRCVAIIGDDASTYLTGATIWLEDHLLYDSVDHMASRIRDRINQTMTTFAAEYYKENP
jgi:hypothetical protein